MLAYVSTLPAAGSCDLADDEMQHPRPGLAGPKRRRETGKRPGDSWDRALQYGFVLDVIARGFFTASQGVRPKWPHSMHAALKPHLARDSAAGQYEEISRRLGIRPLAPALTHLRIRFDEVTNAQMAAWGASHCGPGQGMLFANLSVGG